MVRPDEMRKLKVFSWAGDNQEYELWKKAGFQPVALDSTAIHPGLMSGTISALPMPPFFEVSDGVMSQWR